MYKEDLALNNIQWMICYKTKPNKIGILDIFVLFFDHISERVSVYSNVCPYICVCVRLCGRISMRVSGLVHSQEPIPLSNAKKKTTDISSFNKSYM